MSRFLARSFGRDCVVHNGIDPAEYTYSEVGDDYLLMMAGMDWGTAKGLDTALELWRSVGCRSYVGDVQGAYKAELLARALLFPTRLEDSFGLVMV